MDPLTIAALVEQLITLGLQVYGQIEAANNASANPVTLKPLADIIAEANNNFAQVQANSTL
jgi:hypothetical protein